MATYQVLSQYESKHSIFGSNSALSPDERSFFFANGWRTASAAIKLVRLNANELREEIIGPQIYDMSRGFAWNDSAGMLACSTFKKIYILNAQDLKPINKIGGIGSAPDELSFVHPSGLLVVGSYSNQMVKFIDPPKGEVLFKKKIVYATDVLDGPGDDEVLLGNGPSGKVVCYDCVNQKAKFELDCPPFKKMVKIGNKLILGIGLPFPYYFLSSDLVNDEKLVGALGFAHRPDAADLSSFLPDLRREKLERLKPKQLHWSITDHRPESKTKEVSPLHGSAMVHNIVGLATVDLAQRKVTTASVFDDIPSSNLLSIQPCKTGKRVHLIGKTNARTVSLEDNSTQREWTVKEDDIICALLDEGKRAIVMNKTGLYSDYRRLSLLEQK